MMKLLAILLAALIAVALQASSVAGQSCITFYTRGQAGKFGSYTYTGITDATDIQNYNNPMWYSQASATAGTGTPNGRFMGFLSKANEAGNFAFEFFKTKSWITIQWGKGANGAPNVVTGGTGCYLGRTGTATRTTLQTTPVPVFQWKVCTAAKKTCSGTA